MASSSTSASTCVYDIFISHRGPDCKNTLAKYLYDRLSKHGLRVFLDQPELQEGDPYPSQIEGAIRTASVHIAIFSPRYAESIWCLNELVLMLESNKTIIPIFYGVQPSELRWTQRENGVYARSLSNLQEKTTIDSQTGQEKPRYDSNIIAKWREALSHVANISGFEMETYNGYEPQLVEKVVEGVLMQTRVMGIVGLGGVGKTTLAEIFNRQVSTNNRSCFVDGKYKSGDKNVIGPNTQIDGNLILGDNSGNTNNSGNKINSDNNNTLNSNTVFFYRQELSGNNNMVDRKYKSGYKNVIGPNTQIDGNPILGDNSSNTNNMGNKIREAELKIEVFICEAGQSEVMGKDEDCRSDLMNYCEDSRQQEVYLAEEGIIASSDQREDVKLCTFVTNNFDVSIGFAEDEKSFEPVKSMEEYFSEEKYSKADEECFLNEKSFEAVKSMEEYFSEDKYSKADEECLLNEKSFEAVKSMEEYFSEEKYSEADENCLLNEKSFEAVKSMDEYFSEDKYSKADEECLLNEESSDAFKFEVVTTQGEFLVKEGEEIHSEALEDISHKLKQRNKKDKEIVISDNQGKVISCRKQEGKDDRAVVTIKVQQSKRKSNQQSEDLLDREITSARKLRSRL